VDEEMIRKAARNLFAQINSSSYQKQRRKYTTSSQPVFKDDLFHNNFIYDIFYFNHH